MASEDHLQADDGLLRIEINPPLPCGFRACGRPARIAQIERDPRFDALWRLLPICDIHLASLDAPPLAPSGGERAQVAPTTSDSA